MHSSVHKHIIRSPVEHRELTLCNHLHEKETKEYIYMYVYVCVCVYVYIYIYIYTHTHIYIHTLVAQTVKRLSTMRETRVRSLGWEDLLEKEMATHSRTTAWKIPWTEESGRLQSMGSQSVRHE